MKESESSELTPVKSNHKRQSVRQKQVRKSLKLKRREYTSYNGKMKAAVKDMEYLACKCQISVELICLKKEKVV